MIKNLITPSFLLLSCFVIGGMFFKSAAPRHCGTIHDNDSIFVLTGDERRIPFAIRKMQEYPNADLYIIGVGAPKSLHLARHAIIESKSKSTYQNALAIKKIANEKQLNRIVIITTEDHINRAKYLIHSELPDTEIVTCPATLIGMPPAKRLERWTTEYIKYIVTMFGIKES
jgi:uncharacterized SAM-binding protein YcdF (DUF218 family)